MPPRTTSSNEQLAQKIKNRREELGLSLEEAANRAGVGIKTWYRYESAGSIRNDKVKGVCKALGWPALPLEHDCPDNNSDEFDPIELIDEKHEAWSEALCKCFGKPAAISFALGSDLIYDLINQDLFDLEHMPRGTHLGELSTSWIVDYLPKQFLMRYDYDFVYRLKTTLFDFRQRFHYGNDLHAHTVAEELLIRLIRDWSFDSIEGWLQEQLASGKLEDPELGHEADIDMWSEWPEDLCGDDDFSIFLNNDSWVPEGDEYHFDRWFIPQFYVSK